MKLSGSPSRFGVKSAKEARVTIRTANPRRSLYEK